MCDYYDLPAQGYDPNDETVKNETADVMGRSYGRPLQFDANFDSVNFNPADESDQHTLKVPVSNYFAGHLLEYELNVDYESTSSDYYLPTVKQAIRADEFSVDVGETLNKKTMSLDVW